MASTYQLPCAYCRNGASFPSSDKLKEHLLSNHKQLVCGSRNSLETSKDERSMAKIRSRIPTAEPLKILKSSDFHLERNSPIKNPPSSPFTANGPSPISSSSSQFLPIRSRSTSDFDMVSTMQDKKLKRLGDVVKMKELEINKLHSEIENFKSEKRIKDEEHFHVRQRWRKEAEDVLRNLKTNYEDVMTQKRLMEKQLAISEQEKEKLRSKNDRLEKDLTDLQATAASDMRNIQLKGEAGYSTSTPVTDKKLECDKEMTRLLSTDLQMLRKENDNLAEALASKDDTLKELRNSLSEAEKTNNTLYREVNTLKVKFSNSKTESTQPNSGNTDILFNKLDESLGYQKELSKQVHLYKEKNDVLTKKVNTLKKDKTKLVSKLQEADDVLVNLSNRVTPRTASVENSGIFTQTKMSVASINELNTSLDEIRSILKQLPNRHQNLQSVELHHVTGELQRVNLELVEEKAKVFQLKNSLSELEQCRADDIDVHKQHDEKFAELQKLRSKHRLCVRNEKIRKQLLKEKQLLQRKCSSLQQQQRVTNALFESSKTDIYHKEHIIDEWMAQKKQMLDEAKMMKEEIVAAQTITSERDLLLEKYKRESSYLLEKLNNATEEREDMKKRNESLEVRIDELTSFTDVKHSLALIQKSIVQLKTITNKPSIDSNISANLEVVSQRNFDLSNKILLLQSQISEDKQEVNSLRKEVKEKNEQGSNYKQQINHLEIQIATESIVSHAQLQKNMKDTEYETKIEGLTLENEILSSRVLILEGIREEMELVRNEKNTLKVENKNLKRFSEQRCVPTTTTVDISMENKSKLVNGLVDSEPSSHKKFEENIMKLEQLDENTKLRLREMLSTPEFESFLSTDETYISLKDASIFAVSSSSNDNLTNLSCDSFENEHTVNHLFQAESDTLLNDSSSYEDVIQVYSQTNPNTENDKTINYLQETTEPKESTFCDKPADKPSPKCFDKLFSESKSISKSIAAKRKTSGEIDYKKVLTEFQKVIVEMSGDTSSQTSPEDRKQNSYNRSKKVTFSDHNAVDFYEDPSDNDIASTSSNTASVQQSDSQFYRSFFQDALKRTYPLLAKYEDEDIDNELKGESDIDILNRRAQSPMAFITQQLESTKNSNGSMPNLTDKAMTVMNSDSSVNGGEEKNHPTFGQILDMVKSESNTTNLSSKSIYDAVLKSLPESRQKSVDKSPLSTFKGEEEEIDEPIIVEDKTKRSSSKSSNALNVLKSFINKADVLHDKDIDSSYNSTRIHNANGLVIPIITTNNVIDEPLYFRSIETASEYGNDDIMITVTSSNTDNTLIDNEQYKDSDYSPLSRDGMSSDEFGSSLFRNEEIERLNTNVLHVPGTQNRMSTPSFMHKPVSLDFSDASFINLSLFSAD